MVRLLYVTASTREEALSIGKTLVRERLAACANILDGMTSVCWWDDEVQTGSESVLILKTTAELVDPATKRVVALHSYDTPCVVSLPIEVGHPSFLSWIGSQTKPPNA